jgi:hypothetical protein
VNFVMLKPVFAAPGFLVNAAPHALRVSLAGLLSLSLGALSAGMAIAALPVFRRHSEALALWFLVLAVASFSLTTIESETLLTLSSLSREYASAGASDGALFHVGRVLAASARNWAHYVGLIMAGSMLIVFYTTLYRAALVPRLLATAGLGGAALQLVAVTMPLFGRPVMFVLLFPLGLAHLVLAVWLLARGFEAPAAPFPESGAHGAREEPRNGGAHPHAELDT